MSSTSLVSLAYNGLQGNGNSTNASISQDGRYVAFQSEASNLVPNDTNGVTDIFVRDLQLNTIERVSVDSNGFQANGWSAYPK
jgi:Tol biopolymer transport system component